jgi:putative membrane protein
MTPAMLATYISGLGLIFIPGLIIWSEGWIHVKLLLVLLLTITHGFLAKYRKDFQNDQNKNPQKFYRIQNEVPTILMIGIVTLVVIKPF